MKDNKVGERVKELREALGLSQMDLTTRSGLGNPIYVYRVETGRNAASSHEMRMALAKGFGLEVVDLDAYLSGELSARQALKRIATATRAAS